MINGGPQGFPIVLNGFGLGAKKKQEKLLLIADWAGSRSPMEKTLRE
jgi:hypothetical protein